MEEEQRKIAEEHQKRLSLERARQEEIRNTQLRTRIFNENIAIIQSSEFKKMELLIKEYEKYYHKYYHERKQDKDKRIGVAWILLVVSIILLVFLPIVEENTYGNEWLFFIFTMPFTIIGCIKCFMWESEHPSKEPDTLFQDFISEHHVENEILPIINAASNLMRRWDTLTFFNKKTDFIILSYRKAFHKEFETYLSVFPIRR